MRKESSSSRAEHASTVEFMWLLGQHERSLATYILALVPNWADADEIAQDTKLKLWEQFDRYERGSHFGAWARTIAWYQIQTWRRQQQRASLRFSDQTVELLAADAEKQAEQLSPRHYALEKCLAKLQDNQRELIVECYSRHEESLREVARRLGRKYESTRKSLLRIRRLLAECVDRQVQPEGQS